MSSDNCERKTGAGRKGGDGKRESGYIDLVRLLGGRVVKGDDHETVAMTAVGITVTVESIAIVVESESLTARRGIGKMDGRAGAILAPPVAGHNAMDMIND